MASDLHKVILSAVSKSASFNSPTFPIHRSNINIQMKWTETVATLAGTVKLQVCQTDSSDDTDWHDVTSATSTISGTGKDMYNHSGEFAHFGRLVFTLTGGTGAFTASICDKTNY